MFPIGRIPIADSLVAALGIFLSVAKILSIGLSLAQAETVTTFEAKQKLLNDYLQESLGNPQQKIQKPQLAGIPKYRLRCQSKLRDKCDKSQILKKLESGLVRNNRLDFAYSKDNADLDINFVDQQLAKEKKIELNLKFENGFKDSDDLDCQLYYELNNSTIGKITIVVSLDSSSLKQRICLASQITQGLGLALPYSKPFSQVWKHGQHGFRNFNENDFSALVRSFSILTYLHMCPELKPGMNVVAVTRILQQKNCWEGLSFKSGE